MKITLLPREYVIASLENHIVQKESPAEYTSDMVEAYQQGYKDAMRQMIIEVKTMRYFPRKKDNDND